MINKLYLIIALITSLAASSAVKAQDDNVRVVPLESLPGQAKSAGRTAAYPTLHIDDSEIGKQIRNLHFESAKKSIQSQITQAKRKKQSTEALEKQLNVCENGLSALRGTNKIVFIDSVVVDKEKLLSAYKFDSELGSVALSVDKQMSSFTTELGNVTYRTEKNADSPLRIRSYFVEDGTITNGSDLKGIELEGDMNYPFLLSDGTTFYFASRSDEGHGNYDLYVTRFDSEDGTYLQPTNLGFPFNSYANDYLMVIDESLGIGWFASDRYQPEGKVCVYTFIQPKSRNTFDYETDNHDIIARHARISSIKDTWTDNEDLVRSARQSLTLKQNVVKENKEKYDFDFLINDNYTYHYVKDFKNPEAKAKFLQYQKKADELTNLYSTLSQLRESAKGETIRTQILQLESHISALNAEVHLLAKQTRQLELK